MSEKLDVDRLYKAMCILDGLNPGVFNIVAISEPDTRPVAADLASVYAAISSDAAIDPDAWDVLDDPK